MKKLFILLSLIMVVSLGVQAQSATVVPYTLSTQTLNGAVSATVELPIVMGEYDVSLQLIPALSGSGDSLDFSHTLYLSAALSGDAWTLVAAADTVSSTTDADALVTWTDLKSLRIKAVITGISTDTCTVIPYVVYKKHANE